MFMQIMIVTVLYYVRVIILRYSTLNEFIAWKNHVPCTM